VLIRRDPQVAAGIEQRHGLPAGALPRVMLTSPTARLASVGRIGHGEWLRLVRTVLPPPAVDEWLGYHGELVQPAVALLTAAKRSGVRLLLLSNASRTRWDDLAHHRIGDLADRVFLSAHTGLAKPDPLAYEYVADACALSLSRTLYVDAEPLCVATGRDLGMPSHLYTDASDLRAELIAAGVTI
jgi:FMN phosphatase YigB (HAD superfamily)